MTRPSPLSRPLGGARIALVSVSAWIPATAYASDFHSAAANVLAGLSGFAVLGFSALTFSRWPTAKFFLFVASLEWAMHLGDNTVIGGLFYLLPGGIALLLVDSVVGFSRSSDSPRDD